MRKGFIFAGLLITFTLSYLFYRSCKRDTLVIEPMHRVRIPDSSWVYGSINLEQIKKDIAWSALLNGDFYKLFHTDTVSNTLLTILKSPSDFSIIEQNNILYFSEWKNTYSYTGILFKLKDDNTLTKAYKSDSTRIAQKYVHSFRTKEGFWMYNTNNLIYIATQINDSIYASKLFHSNQQQFTEPNPSDSTLITGVLRTEYMPDSLIHPLLDSARIEISLQQNDTELELDWTYQGNRSKLFTQTSVTLPESNTGLYLSSTQTAEGLYDAINKADECKDFYKKNKQLTDAAITALDGNSFNIKFNGWKKIKTSYIVSVLNDEFEMVLQKKDTNFIEPVFKVSLQQKAASTTTGFLYFLQKEGLISKVESKLFKIVIGNFDSELRIEKNNTITVENKHKQAATKPAAVKTISAALYLEMKPAHIDGLFDTKIHKDIPSNVIEYLQAIEEIRLHVNKDKTQLSGHTHIRFTEKNHPLISLMQVLKDSGQ